MTERGDIWWADLGEPRGSAPARRRPVVLVQADHYNRSRLSTAVIVVLTTNRRLAQMPGNVLIPSEMSGLPEDSVANVTQIATIDRSHLVDYVSGLPGRLMEDIDRGLRKVLGL